MTQHTKFGREEADALIEEYGYAKHSDCRELVLAAYGQGREDAKRDALAQASQARTDGGAVAWEAKILGEWTPTRHPADLRRDGYEVRAATPPGNATQAAGAREPLTDEEIDAEYFDSDLQPQIYSRSEAFQAGVRFAERHHGIASPAAELKKD